VGDPGFLEMWEDLSCRENDVHCSHVSRHRSSCAPDALKIYSAAQRGGVFQVPEQAAVSCRKSDVTVPAGDRMTGKETKNVTASVLAKLRNNSNKRAIWYSKQLPQDYPLLK
jgi:hypothetical protein